MSTNEGSASAVNAAAVPLLLASGVTPTTLRRSFTSPGARRFINVANVITAGFAVCLFMTTIADLRSHPTNIVLIVKLIVAIVIVVISIDGLNIAVKTSQMSEFALKFHGLCLCLQVLLAGGISVHTYFYYLCPQRKVATRTRDSIEQTGLFIFSAGLFALNLVATYLYYLWSRAVVEERALGPLLTAVDGGGVLVARPADDVAHDAQVVVEAAGPAASNDDDVPAFYRDSGRNDSFYTQHDNFIRATPSIQ